MTDHVDSCVIGAGIVGLAIARALANCGREVLVVDRASHYGEGISSRNSEVIHAGIYYPTGSLKARTCVRGKKMLYNYCREKGIAHRRCGKLIVATEPAEEQQLVEIEKRAIANGVDDLAFWSQARVKEAEPAVRASLALYSPSTGIVSSHELMNALLSDLERAGGSFVGRTLVNRIEVKNPGFEVNCDIGGQVYTFSAGILVNAAGLGAQQLAASISSLDARLIPSLFLCKGSYFVMSGRSPFRRLVYPVPEKTGAGLGIHATFDLGDRVKFGPDVEYVDKSDYSVSTQRLDPYYRAIRRYFPGLKDGSLAPDYAGIRPKLHGPGEPPADFIIQGPADHGVAGLIQLFGIESPGLTSSMAIADDVIGLLN